MKMRVGQKVYGITVVLLGILLYQYSPLGAGEELPFAKEPDSYEVATVVRVIDGDTLVADISGVEEKIRLIGVDTPESAGAYVNHPEPGGVEASEYMKALLTEGNTIYLTKDSEDTDRYDRLLRYVWLAPPSGEEKSLDQMVNAILVVEGYADTMLVEPNDRYAAAFEQLKN
ncbi:MAG: thermonuclease family protein [Eubacteriales bacterium]|nr:thermonuclease family protein [Eubacteriales bacterium]